MASYTEYKHLEKPLSTEKYNVGLFNRNSDTIDTELHNLDLKNESQDALLATKESLNRHTDDLENPHSVSKEQIGLGNADNTADLDKPVSTAQRAAINDVYIRTTAYTDTRIADLPDNAQKTLDTLEEIEANTNEGQIAGALAVAEILMKYLTAEDGTRFRYGVTQDGKPGYITTNGDGADTVHPFNVYSGDTSQFIHLAGAYGKPTAYTVLAPSADITWSLFGGDCYIRLDNITKGSTPSASQSRASGSFQAVKGQVITADAQYSSGSYMTIIEHFG